MGYRESGAKASCQIADASVWINLVATGRCSDIVSAFDSPIAIVDVALQELKRGEASGHNAFAHIVPLIRARLVKLVTLEPEDESLFLSLVAGGTAETLDDGEAATLVAAVRLKATALIDERKATSIAQRRFPKLAVRSTTDLLFEALPDAGDSVGPLADSLFAALQGARMRVPPHWHARVVSVLGPDRTRLCLSLPSHIRLAQADAAGGGALKGLAHNLSEAPT